MEPFERIASPSKPTLFFLDRWMKTYANLTAGFTSRIGGVSLHPYDQLNLAFHVGDDPEHVIANRKRVAQAAGFDFSMWTCAEQVHGKRVVTVTAQDRGRGSLTRESAIQDADALVTATPGVVLVSFYADCVPLYFHDPEHGVVALAHAGWKGTALEIAAHVVQRMQELFQTKPSRLWAAIGPAIGRCCYEVDERVASAIMDRFPPDSTARPPAATYPPGLKAKDGGRYDLDLKEINRQIMIKAGIDPNRIECSSYCTGCHRQWFYSHRKEDGRTGRMASWIGIMKKG